MRPWTAWWQCPHWQASGTHLSFSVGRCSLLSLFSICPSTISQHISSSSQSLRASYVLLSISHNQFSSLSKWKWINPLILLLIKSRVKPSLSARWQTQGHFKWRRLCADQCVYTCACVCKIRPGKGEFQSFTGYQHSGYRAVGHSDSLAYL